MLDKSTLARVVTKGLSCGTVRMFVIGGWVASWSISCKLCQFPGLASSLLDVLPILTEPCLFKASASSSSDSSCVVRSSLSFHFGGQLAHPHLSWIVLVLQIDWLRVRWKVFLHLRPFVVQNSLY